MWTVGLSTRPLSEFIALLHSAAITLAADVRRLRWRPMCADFRVPAAIRNAVSRFSVKRSPVPA